VFSDQGSINCLEVQRYVEVRLEGIKGQRLTMILQRRTVSTRCIVEVGVGGLVLSLIVRRDESKRQEK